MDDFFNGFEGIDEPSDSEDDVNILESESLNLAELERHVGLLRERIKIQETQKKEQHKRRIANFILFGSLIFLGLMFIVGIIRDDFEPARLWWMFVGPLVGYLLRVLFEHKGPAP